MLYFPICNSYRRFNLFWWAHWLSPRIYWKTLVVFYQRATRGWAYCDVWSLDSYLCDVIIPALEYLKETKHGTPMPDDAVIDPETGDTTAEESARWERLWNSQLDEMIAGFKATSAILDGPPDFCYTQDAGQQFGLKLDVDKWESWEKEQEEIRQRGFAAFSKHFFALWD